MTVLLAFRFCKVMAGPVIKELSEPCSWTLMSSHGENETVTLSVESTDSLISQVCQALGCGHMLSRKENRAPPNSTCLTGCFYHNPEITNCTEVVESTCTVLSHVLCGNNAVRLVGGSHRCAGRVELWKAGQWGTVCDDGWEKQDADVVCAQLGCGYALSVSGQGGPFGQGKGPIFLDELNCTGTERNLWECPALEEGHDCGHKEDAAVVCSEFKALRLTGGLDRCSGRVEIHRNGTWGTICDSSWAIQEATMACTMLKCGTPSRFTGFPSHFHHNNGTLWWYLCKKEHKHLWECTEYANPAYACIGTHAAGLICNELFVPPAYTELQSNLPAQENNYQESVNIIKMTSNTTEYNGVSNPQSFWTQSSVESTTYDTDQEQNDYCSDPAQPLSTFRNSLRYSAEGRVPVLKNSNLDSVTEEGMLHVPDDYQQIRKIPSVSPSVDSFDSSSTSSGECYENTGTNADDQAATNGYSSGEDSELYSPVSPDPVQDSPESDYDDIGNYQPLSSA
ncbi:scavenger receptor cysteine-rich type 1 protein M130-like [Chanos chanos]|uniref:Scavenger receptor cysteine-rich type 1 protein M130-like n=1 Tax=Chanos chanos TaxID=29144 RepID=A0A6J2WJ08_CHACN|nr:scavenger receptor cysteine-rich type 1 protein M130-like [Chanos chanos]